MRRLAAAVACVASACAHEPLTFAGRQVEVATTAPAGCGELGVVRGAGYAAGEGTPELLLDYALENARNRAAERGATHLVLVELRTVRNDSVAQPDAVATGLAYRCARAAEPEAERDADVPEGFFRAVAAVGAPVRSGPDGAARELFRLEPGARVLASEAEVRGYRRVRAADGRSGFMAGGALLLPR